MLHLDAFKKEKNLIKKLGEGNAHLIWAMGLYLDNSDLIQLASESLTDQKDDKKIDFIRLDRDEKKIIFSQGYYSNSHNKSGGAKSNKASDLNTAAAWLLSGNIDHVPSDLQSVIADCRLAIDNGEVEQVDLLYVHNLPESPSVAKELITASDHLKNHLKDKSISVVHRELGLETLERLYTTQETNLAILEDVSCPSKILFKESGPHWNAGVLTVNGSWLKSVFEKYGEDLFAANYRGFLGITKRRKINTSIRQTAETDPKNFWVFNNGITILTNKIKNPEKETIILEGVSIINGAQTTGSIGSTTTDNELKDVKVLCRIIESGDKDTIAKIVRFNNSQNVITTWDSYSNSEEQKRIQKEFSDLGYNYSLKRGFNDQNSEVGIEQVAPSLIAFLGDFKSANIGKNYIFETKSLYNKAFQNAKARHILLAFALSKAIDEVRLELKTKDSLIEIEQKQLNLLRNLRFKNFIVAVIGNSLESITGTAIDKEHVAFTPYASAKQNSSFNDLIAYCTPIASLILSYVSNMLKKDFSEVLKDDSALEEMSNNVNVFIYNIKMGGSNQSIENFNKIISPKG